MLEISRGSSKFTVAALKGRPPVAPTFFCFLRSLWLIFLSSLVAALPRWDLRALRGENRNSLLVAAMPRWAFAAGIKSAHVDGPGSEKIVGPGWTQGTTETIQAVKRILIEHETEMACLKLRSNRTRRGS